MADQQAQEQQQQQPAYPQPPVAAIQRLQANPDKIGDFERIFGPGSGVQHLSGQSPTDAVTTETPTEEKKSPGVLDTIGDTVAGLTAGAVPGAINNLTDLWNQAGKDSPFYIEFGSPGPGTVQLGPLPPMRIVTREEAGVRGLEGLQVGDLPEYAPTTMVGSLAKGIGEFVVGFAATSMATGGLGGGIAANAARGAATDFAFIDAAEGNLSSLIESAKPFGIDLSNPISGFLAVEGEDNLWEGRIKNTLEGLVIGSVIDGLTTTLRLLKRAKAGEDIAEDLAKHQANVAELQDKIRTERPEIPTTGGAVQRDIIDVATRGLDDSPRVPYQAFEDATGEVEELFNVGKWNTTEDIVKVHQRVREAIERSLGNDFDSVQTLAAARDEAATMTDNVDELFVRLQQYDGLADEAGPLIVAGKSVYVGLAQAYKRFRRMRANTRPGTPEYAQAEEAMQQTFRALAAYTLSLDNIITGMARGTSAGRIRITGAPVSFEDAIQFFRNVDGDEEIAMARFGELSKNPYGFKSFLETVFGNRSWDVVNEYYINSLLSGPVTHAINFISNSVESVVRPGEYMFAGLMHGNPKLFREGVDRYVGLSMSMYDSARMALRSFIDDQNILDPTSMINDNPTSHAIHIARREGATGSEEALRQTVNAVGTIIRVPSRFLMASDEYFKQLNFRASVYAQVARQGRDLGLSGRQLAQHIEEATQKVFDDLATLNGAHLSLGQQRVTNPILLRAREEAREATFTQEHLPGTFGKGIQNLVNQYPALRLILPFVRTPANLVGHSLQRTAPGLARTSARYRAAIAAGGETAQLARGRATMGSMVLGTAAVLAAGGHITGQLHSDPQVRKHMYDQGQLPYSFRITDEQGKTHYIQFNRGDPRFMIFGMVADLIERQQEFRDEGIDYDDLVGALIVSFASNFASKSYMKGLSDTLDVIVSNDVDKANRVLRQYAEAAVPYSSMLRQVDDNNPELLEARSYMDAVMKNLPGAQEHIDPRRNILGDPIIRPHLDGPGFSVSSPFAYSKMKSDAALHAFAKLGRGFRLPPKKPQWAQGVDLTEHFQPSGRTAYDRYQELVGTVKLGGKSLKQRLNEITNSSKFRAWLSVTNPDDSRDPAYQTVSRVLSAYRKKAQIELLKEPWAAELAEAVREGREAKVASRRLAIQASSKADNLISEFSQ